MQNIHDTQAHGANKPTYNLVFAVLAVVTVIELIASEIAGLPGHTLLLAATFLKAGLVVAYYMHLKYDPPIFTWIFVVPIIMAIAIILSLQGLAGY